MLRSLFQEDAKWLSFLSGVYLFADSPAFGIGSLLGCCCGWGDVREEEGDGQGKEDDGAGDGVSHSRNSSANPESSILREHGLPHDWENALNMFQEGPSSWPDVDISDSEEEKPRNVACSLFVMVGYPVRRSRVNFQNVQRNAKTFWGSFAAPAISALING